MVAHIAITIVERTLAAKLAVPDLHLCSEIAERAVGPDIDALFRGGGAQREEWRHGVAMQCHARVVELFDVRASATGELEWIHARLCINLDAPASCPPEPQRPGSP